MGQLRKPVSAVGAFALLAAALAGAADAGGMADAPSGSVSITARTGPTSPEGHPRIHFEPNLGQSHPDTAFTARAAGYTFFLTAEEAVFALAAGPGPRAEPTAVRMRFVDAGPDARFRGERPTGGVSNYYRGADPERWASGVPHYSRVVVSDLWPGVDAVFFGTAEGAVRYDFVVHPGADPAAVRLGFEGAQARLDADGGLTLEAGEVALRQRPPFTYQVPSPAAAAAEDQIASGAAAILEEVPSRFRLLGSNQVGFAVAPYDTSRPLVIDPVVVAPSTYLGGRGSDVARGVAVGPDGSIYVAGEANSDDFPTKDPHQPDNAGAYDVFVARFTPAGDALIYSTYLGGNTFDSGSAIAVGPGASAVVVGDTSSENFPTSPGVVQPLYGGGSRDAFAARLTAEGALIYSTFLGGGAGDIADAVALQADGTATVAGVTWSANFPTTPGATQPTSPSNGSGDAFVVRLSPDGSTVGYATYLGGTGFDRARGVAVDTDGSAYVAGRTSSDNFPTQSPFQPGRASSGDETDAFVATLAPGGDALVYSTYLGGGSQDAGQGIALRSDGAAVVVGTTNSSNFPTANAFQPSHAGGIDAFVTVLSPAGSTLVWSTYLGGTLTDIAEGVAVDSDGTVAVAGWTTSGNFPTKRAFQADKPSSLSRTDAFVTTLTPGGDALVWSTYIGGANDDSARAVAFDPSGNPVVAGAARSTDFPASEDAFQPEHAGGLWDAVLARFVCCAPSAPRDLSAEAGPGLGEITLFWEEPELEGNAPVEEYRIGRATQADGPYEVVATVAATAQAYTDTGLGNGATRHYRVSAVSETGESPLSAPASARTFAEPSAPLDVSAVAGPGSGEVTVSWAAPADDGGRPLEGYRVSAAGSAGGPYTLLAEVDAGTTAMTESGLGDGEDRFYVVSARNEVGEGPPSDETSARTFAPPSAPGGVNAAAGPDPGEVTVSWGAPTDDGGAPIQGYRVYGAAGSGGPYALLVEVDAGTTAMTESGLGDGEDRHYVVSALNAAGEGTPSAEASARTFTVPSAPRNPVANPGPDDGEITLAWDAPADHGGTPVETYRVYAADDTGGPYTLAGEVAAPLRSFRESGLAHGQTRHYVVVAVNQVGESAVSAEASGVTFAEPSAPRAPAAAAGPDPGELSLTWVEPETERASPVNAYWIYRSDSPASGFTLHETVGPEARSFRDGGLPDGATRFYRVTAVNDHGESEPSPTVNATTFIPPSAPRNPAAVSGPDPGTITVTWEAPEDDGGMAVEGYRVYGADAASGPYALLEEVPAATMSVVESGLADGQTRFYRVTALSRVGEGPPSAAVAATSFGLPSPPQNLTARPGSGLGQIRLAWEAPAAPGGPLSGYRIYRSTSEGGPFTLHASVGPETVVYTDSGEWLRTYYYRVTATNPAGEGAPSNIACHKPFPWFHLPTHSTCWMPFDG